MSIEGGEADGQIERLVAIVDAAAPIDDPTQAADAPPHQERGSTGAGANVVQFPPATAKGGKRKKRKKRNGGDGAAAAPGGHGEVPIEPRAFGFSVEDLNREYALVLMGSKAVVFLEQPHARIEDQKRVLSLEAFNAWLANRFTEQKQRDGAIKAVTWAKAWLQSRDRRQYRGIEFFPDPNNTPGLAGYLNLWSGFAYAPAAQPDPKRYKTFRDHLLNNIARGDEQLFRWVFGFFAHMVQKPRERIGVALVLRGGMGTGKTKVGEIIGALFPAHYFLVDDPRYVTGQFNAHMASCLLLQADEAVWAGDKAAEGRLKGLITSPIQQIEAKGVDPIRLANYVRLIMTSNEDWVVPAGKDERRFAVLDVDPGCAKNHAYFAEMDAELADGGFEHLLGALLRFPLHTVDLRNVPRTEALLEQKIRSLDSVESWWFGRLQAGTTTRGMAEWKTEIPGHALFGDYIATAEQIGVRRKAEEIVFGLKLGRLVNSLGRTRPRMTLESEHGGQLRTERVRCYVLPDLETCRRDFERVVNQPVTWPADSEASGAESGEGANDVVPL